MAIIKWTPLYEPLLDIERAFDEFAPFRGGFSPAIDMYEKGDDIVVDVALAGIDPEKVQIDIEDNVLNIEGRLEQKTEVDEKNYYRKEVRAGSFHRMVSLPSNVHAASTKAEYHNGILKITMPKREE